MVDKNLFMYDLAVVAIMKDEGHYIKEWLDYHLLAGVNHFYIYDNDSSDNMKEVLQSYIESGIVTYAFCPGKVSKCEVYNDAIQNFKFDCKYMVFIDADEFICLRNNKEITETLDKLTGDQNIAAVGIGSYVFGSNYHDRADHKKGVLERFTRRDSKVDNNIRIFANPRKIDYFSSPNYAICFEHNHIVSEKGEIIPADFAESITADKISVNCYYFKSKEEFANKIKRGNFNSNVKHKIEEFEELDKNEVLDDGILKYRNKKLASTNIKNLTASNQVNNNNIVRALIQNVSPVFGKKIALEAIQGRMETFLTCRRSAEYLRESFLDESAGNFYEEMSLKAVHRTIYTQINIADIKLLISELPKILKLKYPIVKDIRKAILEMIPQLMSVYRSPDGRIDKEYMNLKYIAELLKITE